jgi:hypothetical protein
VPSRRVGCKAVLRLFRWATRHSHIIYYYSGVILYVFYTFARKKVTHSTNKRSPRSDLPKLQILSNRHKNNTHLSISNMIQQANTGATIRFRNINNIRHSSHSSDNNNNNTNHHHRFAAVLVVNNKKKYYSPNNNSNNTNHHHRFAAVLVVNKKKKYYSPNNNNTNHHLCFAAVLVVNIVVNKKKNYYPHQTKRRTRPSPAASMPPIRRTTAPRVRFSHPLVQAIRIPRSIHDQETKHRLYYSASEIARFAANERVRKQVLALTVGLYKEQIKRIVHRQQPMSAHLIVAVFQKMFSRLGAMIATSASASIGGGGASKATHIGVATTTSEMSNLDSSAKRPAKRRRVEAETTNTRQWWTTRPRRMFAQCA